MKNALFITSILFLSIIIGCSSQQSLKDWQIAIKENPITIAYAGKEPEIKRDGVNFIPIHSSQPSEALWIGADEFDNFTTEEGIQFIKELLEQNKFIVFITEENAYDTITQEIGIIGYEELLEGSSEQHGFYLWNENEETQIGFVFGHKESISWNIFLEQTAKHCRELH